MIKKEGRAFVNALPFLFGQHWPADICRNGVDLRNFLVAELARSFGFPLKNRAAESLGDFRYGLCLRHLPFAGRRRLLKQAVSLKCRSQRSQL